MTARISEYARQLVRDDLDDLDDADHPVRDVVVFLAELPMVFALAVRGFCYFWAAFLCETLRQGEEPVFTAEDDVVLRWSWLGPGWEHATQSNWEIRVAAACCVLAGAAIFQLIAVFPLEPLQSVLLWVNCGALVLEPAWSKVYLARSQSATKTE